MNILNLSLFALSCFLSTFACSSVTTEVPACDLSQDKFSANIVGGEKTSVKEFPFIGVIFMPITCGCNIISKNYAISSASCTYHNKKEILPEQYQIRFGSTCMDKNGVTSNVTSYVRHPLYKDDNSHDYDYAIFKLKNSLNFGENLKAIPFSNEKEIIAPGTMAWIAGWGKAKDGDPRTLRKAKISIVDFKKCEENYVGKLTERMICAGRFEGDIESCQGFVYFLFKKYTLNFKFCEIRDVGGPLVIQKNGNYQLVGVTSWVNKLIYI